MLPMSTIRSIQARIVHILPYLALGAAVVLLATAIAVGPPFAEMLNAYALMSGVAGLMALVQRVTLRVIRQQHAEVRAGLDQHRIDLAALRTQIEELGDQFLLMSASGVGDALHAHLGPDSLWRRNLIKEVADYLNDDNTITLAALEGSVADLSERLATLERVWRIQRGK